MSLHDKEVVKAEAIESKMPKQKPQQLVAKKEAVVVNHNIAEILKKLGLGMPEHKQLEAVVVDAKVGELIKALHLGKAEHAQVMLI